MWKAFEQGGQYQLQLIESPLGHVQEPVWARGPRRR